MPSRPLWLTLAPFIFLVLWSMGYSVAKIGLRYTEPMTLLALRFGCVIVIMAVLFLVLKPPLPKDRAGWLHLAFVGFLLQAVYFGMNYYAFDSGVGAGTLALIMSFQPIFVALLAPLLTKEVIGRGGWVGLTLGLLGTLLVIGSRVDIEPPTLLGITFSTIALMGITSGSLWEKRFGLSHHRANLSGHRQFRYRGRALACYDPRRRCEPRVSALLYGAAICSTNRLDHAWRGDATTCMGRFGTCLIWRLCRDPKA